MKNFFMQEQGAAPVIGLGASAAVYFATESSIAALVFGLLVATGSVSEFHSRQKIKHARLLQRPKDKLHLMELTGTKEESEAESFWKVRSDDKELLANTVQPPCRQ